MVTRITQACLLGTVLTVAARADLKSYVTRQDATYRWSQVAASQPDAELQHAELHMISQTWRGVAWQHRLFIVRPPDVRQASHAILIIGSGDWREGMEKARIPQNAGEIRMAREIAAATKLPVAYLSHVPFQPMFDGKEEDELVAYTFDQFMRTLDEEWLLLLPMTKSAVRAMDTVQAFAKQAWQLEIGRFIVTGASKRGWTTWLTGAADPRVAAIAPMVIDVLNIPAQMRHQREIYGQYSEQISDYTRLELPDRVHTPEGRKLIALIDPYAYRERLTMPKMILLGTNDRYWTLDALNLYYDGLPDEKYISYTPNAGHNLASDLARLIGNISAFSLKTAGELEFPRFTWTFEPRGGGLRLTMRSDLAPARVNVWQTTAPTRDFRKARWTSTPQQPRDKQYTFVLEPPAGGYAAAFGEAVYDLKGRPLALSTQLRIIGNSAGNDGK